MIYEMKRLLFTCCSYKELCVVWKVSSFFYIKVESVSGTKTTSLRPTQSISTQAVQTYLLHRPDNMSSNILH
jgi:hypothetical protein